MTDAFRKASQEVEIDHLIAEEFACDVGFAKRFLAAAGLLGEGFEVIAATPEPSLGGEGYGDLLVEGRAGGRRVALLIEDKITAGPATRQVKRYRAHAARLREAGWDAAHCILVAPAAYRGERDQYDGSVDLETVAQLLRSPEPKRLAFRRAILERALEKRASTGVRLPDERLYELRAAYTAFAAEWCAREGVPLEFPPLRSQYWEGDTWIEHIRHPDLPAHVKLRYRMWSTAVRTTGHVDLIASLAEDADRRRFSEVPPPGATPAPFSGGKGVQVSVPVAEMRQREGFDPDAAAAALGHMRDLVRWYRGG